MAVDQIENRTPLIEREAAILKAIHDQVMASSSRKRAMYVYNRGKLLAKLIKKNYGIKHSRALDIVALHLGYANWHECFNAMSTDECGELRRQRIIKKDRTMRRRTRRWYAKWVAGRARADAEVGRATSWRGLRTMTSLMCEGRLEPIDWVATKVVFRPYSGK